jgi:hypothetical protein
MTAGTRAGQGALRTLGITSSAIVWALGCNAILGIDEGKLVSADAAAGGSGTKNDGSASGGDTSGSTGGSGDGGKGTGGAATGGAGGSGTGGAAGGTGGKGTGGAATGGTAGTGGAGAGGTPNGVAGEVRCGTASCKLSAGQVCCVATATGDAHCSTSCDSSTQQKFACDGAEDCASPTAECCYANGATTAACAGACQGRVFCGANADCAPGQYCAPGTGPLATVSICTNAPKKGTVWCNGALCDVTRGNACCYDKAAKTESCVAATACASGNVSFACDGPDDCPVAGSVCCATRTGLNLLTGGQCSTTGTCPMNAVIDCGGTNGCAAGFTCCLTAATGAPACAAMCNGAQTVCGTDADCAGAICAILTDPAIGKPTGRTFCK